MIRSTVRTFLPGVGLALALALFPTTAQAQWGGEIRGQMGIGGDEIASVTYSDGSDSELKAGTYFSFSLGPIYQAWAAAGHSVELQAMAGWAGWSTGPENTDDRLSLNRFPLDVLAYYGFKFPGRDMSLRVGGGMSYHMISGVSGSGSLDAVDLEVENSAGPVVDASLVFGIVSAGVRYTSMNTVLEGVPSSLDGSSMGFYLGIITPR